MVGLRTCVRKKQRIVLERFSLNIKTRTGASGQGGAPVFHPCETGSLLHANFRSTGNMERAERYAATSLESENVMMTDGLGFLVLGFNV